MEQSLENLLRDLEQYLKENLDGSDQAEAGITPGSGTDQAVFPAATEESIPKGSGSYGSLSSTSLDALLNEVGKSFHEMLFDLVRESGMTDVEVYKRANMDRKLFSKIRSNPAYHPRKDTVLALAIALRLSLGETEDLLSRAEYALSPSSRSDLIVRFFIERKVYDIDIINIALHEHGLPILE